MGLRFRVYGLRSSGYGLVKGLGIRLGVRVQGLGISP